VPGRESRQRGRRINVSWISGLCCFAFARCAIVRQSDVDVVPLEKTAWYECNV
jgi:hypothetical protein